MQNISDASLHQLVEEIAQLLVKQQKQLVTAESCTGGWVAKCCTDLAGSSAWFERGFVTYSNEAKIDELGVAPATLDKNGAVSLSVVEEMALGALAHSNADMSVAITGIAGPEGGTTEKPVGTVWIGWAMQNAGVHSICFQFAGDRNTIRKQAVFEALTGIVKNARD
ncbi:C-terminal domain of CinA type S [Methylophaga thiooxydans]|uniref:C-terminal domain of CinA type S n=1 Tax=Methylophaga thiooxydans TaxID=392484 RepID=A0A0A0BEB7_9GAMM|nr:nicotinamide-nucleotide amidohydrolase family protein [Methylophaga thiooxydans]KGM06878.1 C-terminal domain of CinA type S [Methylophaga thiooxydans]